ncbi:lysine-specific demethylase JMJ25-like isoform X1 [Quillaja saponaria]|uniref:Lysine-specific demethylase JMJ25-like isoform X1 n=1 Tax=Quillaja saponaria TaxID=32244 RepID=A0AAD7KUJ1_QUISA|nr:lysine-specific demethylase JMJ25-like isoform X1 [Quillaja saponaria]
MEVLIAQQNQYPASKLRRRISKLSKVSKLSKKRQAEEVLHYRNKELMSEEEEDHSGFSKRRAKHSSKRGDGSRENDCFDAKRILKRRRTVSNKERNFEDDTIDRKEENEEREMVFLLKTNSRSRTRKLDSMMDERNLEDAREKKIESRITSLCSSVTSRSPNSILRRHAKSYDKHSPKSTKGNGEDFLKCHQCMKKRTAVPCTMCKQKLYCIQCIKKWYPCISEADIAKSCPFCRRNCNCNVCLCSNIYQGHC